MNKLILILIMILLPCSSQAASITYSDKTTGDEFTAADANEIKTVVNGKQDALGADDNYVTDAEKTVIGNTSGTNTGDDPADDTAYDATSWDANTDAATKNAIRDKIETLGDSGEANETMDSTPTDGNTDHTVSSDGIELAVRVLTPDSIEMEGGSDGPQILLFKEDSDNGTNVVGIGSPSSNNNNLVELLPTSDPTEGQIKAYSAPTSITSKDGVTINATQASWISPGDGSGDLLAAGTVPLTANWDVGPYYIKGLQFLSDIANGTSPFVVASQTQVDNLNAEFLGGELPEDFEDADPTILKEDEIDTPTKFGSVLFDLFAEPIIQDADPDDSDLTGLYLARTSGDAFYVEQNVGMWTIPGTYAATTSTTLTCSPDTYDPANGTTATSDDSETLTCTANNGAVTFTSYALDIGTFFADAGTGTCGQTEALAQDGSCTIDLIFQYDTGAASNHTDTLTIESNAADETVALGPTTVTVESSGVLSFSPTSWDPADGDEATADATQEVTVTATGGPVEFTSDAFTTGTYFADAGTGTCTGTTELAEDGSCTYDLIFQYDTGTVAAHTDTFTVNSDASDDPNTLSLGPTTVSGDIYAAVVPSGYTLDTDELARYSTRVYNTLSAAEAGEGGEVDGVTHYIDVLHGDATYNWDSSPDTTNVTFDGWDCINDGEVVVRTLTSAQAANSVASMPDYSSGAQDTTEYILRTSGTAGIYVDNDAAADDMLEITFIGIQQQIHTTSGVGIYVLTGGYHTSVTVEKCWIDQATDNNGVYVSDDTDVYFINSVISGSDGASGLRAHSADSNLYVVNSTVVNASLNGINRTNGTLTTINTLVTNSANDFYGTLSGTHNASDDADGPGTNISPSGSDWDNELEDGSGLTDLRPLNTGNIYLGGEDQDYNSLVPSEDIVGNSRPTGSSPPTIGAFEYVAP